MVLTVTRGSAVPVEFSRFAKRTGMESVRAIRSFSKATAGLFDGAIDYWASFWGALVKKVEFDLRTDGSAVATYHLFSPFTFHLSSADMRQIRRELFSTRAMTDLMPQYERAVRRGAFSRRNNSRHRRGRVT